MYEHLKDTVKIIDETRKMIQVIAYKPTGKIVGTKNGKDAPVYDIDLDHAECDTLRKNLDYLYNERGMGYKLLCKELGNISYTRIRKLLKSLNIETRKGTSCVTDSLRALRSERAKINNPWTDWTGKDALKGMHRYSKRHLSGWYLNKSKNKLVWLRSSWEYAYASYLDRENIEWDVEVRSFLLSDGRYYRPDFFIYEKNKLEKIVEIKSTWANGSQDRIEKFETFKVEYPETAAVLLSNEMFNTIGVNSMTMLKEWKKIRILEKNND